MKRKDVMNWLVAGALIATSAEIVLEPRVTTFEQWVGGEHQRGARVTLLPLGNGWSGIDVQAAAGWESGYVIADLNRREDFCFHHVRGVIEVGSGGTSVIGVNKCTITVDTDKPYGEDEVPKLLPGPQFGSDNQT